MGLTFPIAQIVYTVGEPPKDKICFFRGLKNVVVLSAVGAYGPVSALHCQNFVSGVRSLASCLAGGDLDGYVICVFHTLVWFMRFSRDTYDIYFANLALLPTIRQQPAPMSASSVFRLEESKPDPTVDDICKFIVEYINSDVMVRSLLGLHALTEAYTFCTNHRVC